MTERHDSAQDRRGAPASAHLTGRYWAIFAVLAGSGLFDMFDMFVVGFIVARLGSEWSLSYGQAALMLMAGGVGAIAGALTTGLLADRFGRRSIFLLTTGITGLGSLALAFVPSGAWVVFCLIRAVVGFGAAGAATAQAAMMVELTPPKWRSILPGISVTIASLGVFVASLTSALLLDAIGWRGLAMVGSLPILFCVVGYWVVPESPLWLARRQNPSAADISVAAQDMSGNPQDSGRTSEAGLSIGGRLVLLFVAWLCISTAANGLYLWGPTVLGYVTKVSVQQAAAAFILVSIAGLAGKLAFSFSPHFIGRRPSAQIAGFCGALSLAVAALWPDLQWLGTSAFLLGLMGGAFFLEGAYSNLVPFAAEMMPVRYAGRGVGIAQAGNGVGKIMGPFLMAAVAGTGGMVTPEATVAAAEPAFLLLGAFALALGVVFTVFRIETQGRARQK